MKRVFDFFCAFAGLLLLLPVFVLIALAIKLDSRGPVLFYGKRVGRACKPFYICKFRTMVKDADRLGAGITVHGDARVTRVGKWLRRTKLDEFPQLINVLKGEMSLVGPRPEDPRYVPYYTPEQRLVLSVLPGMTSTASLYYRSEEQLLTGPHWEQQYINEILPSKLALELEYIKKATLMTDIGLIAKTIAAVFQ